MSALDYDKSRHYSKTIIMTIQRVVGATVDGKWGPETVEHVRVWQGHHGLKPDGKVGPTTLRLILEAVGHPQDSGGDCGHGDDDGGHGPHDPPGVSDKIKQVGVWATHHSFGRHAAADIKFCTDHRINRLDVFVNTTPKSNDRGAFHMHDRGEIVDLCRRATDANMTVNITSWITPESSFIEGAAEQLIPLCRDVGASSLVWDAEEPWNRDPDADFETAAQLTKRLFAELSCPMNVSGIINTRVNRFGPLARVCEVMIPQCYATCRNNLDPRDIVSTALSRWRDEFADNKPFIIGLAAYRQAPTVHGLGTREAMISSLREAASLGIHTVSYWSLPSIKKSRVIAELISEIRNPER